jgi:hypothetical protein
MDFLTPDGGASVVDSVEEMFAVDKKRIELELKEEKDESINLCLFGRVSSGPPCEV